ncbi:hypothetical protein OG369_39805 [Streptomyces sp. NBC_01221]|uniref:hypothetical protein n=1 Tax=Streptomyces sp. NBC_01221 TaxID=2903782 RepID=UPI00225BC827|nr:hypothetical protein [Streptomyces sp. NBC_01221]MCX4791996.1 hypothetical protein [Streptomyces sp. NBC_01221]
MSSPSTAALVSQAVSQALSPGDGNCTDPSCARHAGTTLCPPFSTTHSSGAVIGDAVAEAWHAAGGSQLDIPAGIVAALAMWPRKSPGAEDADGQLFWNIDTETRRYELTVAPDTAGLRDVRLTSEPRFGEGPAWTTQFLLRDTSVPWAQPLASLVARLTVSDRSPLALD